MSEKRRYAQVGIGGRGAMYMEALATEFAETCELVAIVDRNAGRLQQRIDWLQDHGCQAKGYLDKDFDRMIAECKPDGVVVTSIDASHSDYLCRAMELGCDVVSEKPMTIDAPRCLRIIDTQRRTGRECKVTFNCRYAPAWMQVKDLLMTGVIGDVISVDFHWMLDTTHGASYFRRWHRNMANSGGLLLHKATHHFDLANWWLSAVPKTVFAMGKRDFYLPQTAERYGLSQRAEYCRACPETARCPFFYDLMADEDGRKLYADNEQYDGYIRDRCPFSAEIDINDSMQLTVAYDTGVTMSYSLNTYLPIEGLFIAFNGSKGRMEHATLPKGTHTRIYPHFANHKCHEVEIWEADGSHGGADPLLLKDLFAPDGAPDKYQRAADQRAGAYSILTGIAANESIRTGQAIQVAELAPGIERPDFPPMPAKTTALV